MLTKEEQRWTTTEKEAFAIVYCLKKLEYLIRDRTFTLRTDHKNLTYIDNHFSAKVKRWKLLVQEYDFFIEHIPGKDNVVADGFSRLLPIEDEVLFNLYEELPLTQEVYDRISHAHNGVVGHHGVDRTMIKLWAMGKRWAYVREHVKCRIRQCPCCQKMSFLNVAIHKIPFTTAVYEPMERLEIDVIGPLPADEDGNRFILVIIDCFTRRVSLYLLS